MTDHSEVRIQHYSLGERLQDVEPKIIHKITFNLLQYFKWSINIKYYVIREN